VHSKFLIRSPVFIHFVRVLSRLGVLPLHCLRPEVGTNTATYMHLTNHDVPYPAHSGSVPDTNCMMHGGIQFYSNGWLLQVNFRSFLGPSRLLPLQVSTFPMDVPCCASALAYIDVSTVVRQCYNIRGNATADVLTAARCIPRDLVRQSREIELEEQRLGQKIW
jgi:hypothetical protein